MKENTQDSTQEKIGLIAGYKPNRISLYILMLVSGRYDDLMDCLYRDMEEYKIDDYHLKLSEVKRKRINSK